MGPVGILALLCACAQPLVEPRILRPGNRAAGREKPATAGVPEIADYATALRAIADAFERELGLPRPDAALVLFANRRSLEAGLLSIGYQPRLARDASGFRAIGGADAVLVNEDGLHAEPWAGRVRLLAHELAHSVQYRFAGGKRGASDQWLREGVADWVACRTIEALGFAVFASCREDLLEQLERVRRDAAPAPLEKLVTFPQWVAAQREYADVPLYAQAFVSAELLIEQQGLSKVSDYFSRFAASADRLGNFRRTFGRELASFEPQFRARWRQELMRRSRVQGPLGRPDPP